MTALHCGIEIRSISHKRQNVHKSRLHHRIRRIPHSIAHRDSPLPGISDVDIVHTGRSLADKTKPRSRINQSLIYHYLIDYQNVTIRDTFPCLFSVGTVIEDEFTFFAYRVERNIPHRRSIKKNNFHIYVLNYFNDYLAL